jgi:hypothetical protein
MLATMITENREQLTRKEETKQESLLTTLFTEQIIITIQIKKTLG